MTLPSPIVLINGSPQINGINVSAGSTVSISLASIAGVYTWSLQCIGTDDKNTTSGVQGTLSLNAANFTATYTQPSTARGSAVIFRSTVNNGIDVNGVAQPYLTTTFGTYVPTSIGNRLAATNETLEGDSVYGWVSKFNNLTGTSASGVTWSQDLAGSSDTVQQVVGLYTNPLASTSPVQSAVPVWDTSGPIYNVRQLTQDDIAAGFTINSFTGGSTLEIGASVINPAFSASYNHTPTSATINNADTGTNSLTTPFTSYTYSHTFTHNSLTNLVFTLTAVSTSTKTATSTISWLPRSFIGVGAAGASSTVTASGNNATLSTGDTINSAGLHSTDVGQTYGPVSPSAQKIYILCIGGSHTFKDASTGFGFAFNSPATVSFSNQFSATVTMALYESTNLLTGTFSILVAS